MAASGPERTCIGCRQVAAAERLVRVTRSPEGTLAVGRSLEGRGAWLCSGSRSCFEVAAKRDAFRRAFRVPVHRNAVVQLRIELFGGEADTIDFVPGDQPARDC